MREGSERQLIIEHLNGTVVFLDDVRADPDELFKVGAAICRLENLIEYLENEGGKCGWGTADRTSPTRVSGVTVLRVGRRRSPHVNKI
jgi:hypothetical protein